jgi:iron-sulfur cluster assembly accessory protein
MSVETFDPSQASVTLTPAAQDHFLSMLSEQPNKMIRLTTKLSGCTGFAYVLDMVEQPANDDEVIKISQALTFLVSAKAKDIVKMTEIDYVKEGLNGMIKYNNPNVINECGCGESFSVG